MTKSASNPDPVMTRRLLHARTWNDTPMRVIDGGARWGAEHHWHVYGDQLDLFAFEPAEDECRRLMAEVEQGAGKIRFACEPLALARTSGRSTINVARFPDSSSLFPTNDALVRRFSMAHYLEKTGEVDVDTTSVDAFAERRGLNYVDFMKLDVEGAELEVLEGAQRVLNDSLLGLSVEVWFHEEHVGRPLFAEIDAHLRTFGFLLFDLRELNRWRRNTLAGPDYYSWVGSGQLMYAQALYLRDLPGHDASRCAPTLPSTAVLKLASLAELFSYPDYAIEVIEWGQGAGLLGVNEAPPLIDALRSYARTSTRRSWKRATRRAARVATPPAARRAMKRWIEAFIEE